MQAARKVCRLSAVKKCAWIYNRNDVCLLLLHVCKKFKGLSTNGILIVATCKWSPAGVANTVQYEEDKTFGGWVDLAHHATDPQQAMVLSDWGPHCIVLCKDECYSMPLDTGK